MSLDLAKENPYVAVASKKHRNLKKKMEKIVKIEQMVSQGKTLDQEQLAVLNSKKSVEKALADVAALKAQLEEVAKQQLEEQQGKPSSAAPETVEEQDEKADTQENIEATEEPIVSSDTANVETNTELDFQLRVVQYAVSTMTEPDAEAAKANEAKKRAESEEKISKLLKALHVYQRFKDVTSRNLPDNVDFFGRTLLGLTTISGFQDTLNHSNRVAAYYLNEDLAVQNEVVRGCNYVQMSQLIDSLAEEMDKVPPNRGGVGTLTALLRNSISAPAMHPSEPTINVPPVPHIPPATDVPVITDISPSKFDIPSPQPVPQFVTIEPPSFGTLQFGAVTTSASLAPAALAPAPAASPLYATINFQPEPFFQLTPPAVSVAPQPVSAPVAHEPVVSEPVFGTVPAPEPVSEEPEANNVPVSDSTDTAGDDANAQGEQNKSEGEDNAADANDPNAANKRSRNRNNRRRNNNNKEGGENVEGGAAVQGQGRNNNNKKERFNKDRPKKEGEEGGAGSGGEGNKGGFQKKRSFNREKNDNNNNNTNNNEGAKETKDYNWTKKFNNKRAENKESPRKEGASEAVETPEPAAPQPVVQAETSAPAPKPEPVAAEPASKPAEPVEAPKAEPAPAKKFSYQDIVRSGLASTQPEAKPAAKAERKETAAATPATTGEEGTNNGAKTQQSGNRDNRDFDRKRDFRNRQGGDSKPQGDRPPRTFNRDNNNNGEQRESRPYNNNRNNNNNNNNRTVNNNNQSVRRPAPAAKTESA